jgi:Uma2 family endonuclease
MSTHPVLPPARFTMAEYLAFERAATERHEYLDGLIYAMAGESENHGRICVNLTAILVPQLRGSGCEMFSKDTKVLCGPYRAHTREGLYAYPDLVVICGGGQYHDQARDVLLNPTALFEVLSPSTEAFDRGEKFVRYRHWLPSLQDYGLVAQEHPMLDHYHRTAPDQWTLTTAYGLDASLVLPTLGVRLALRDVYERVAFPTPLDDAQE